ncbi:hypothetical protein K488DRAFT_16073, partial [Vararia minispora EC-137]
LILAYDIACQWYKNLLWRLLKTPEWSDIYASAMRFKDLAWRPVVPKFHLAAHKESCQSSFNLNYTPGAGESDGEASEQVWAGFNPFVASLKEMGPGHHQDHMEDRCSWWNWAKHIGIGR